MSIEYISPQQDTIQQTFARLIAVQNQPINSTDAIRNDLTTIKSFQNAYCCATPEYTTDIAPVRSSVPSTVVPGTVGEYLYACFQPDVVGQLACNPSCTNGLRNPDLQACNAPSFLKSNGSITKINDVMGISGNLYLAAGQVYTDTDRQYLLSEGLQTVTIYSQNGNSANYILGETVDLNQPVSQVSTPGDPTNTTNNSGWGWGWFWLIVIIVVVIILALFLVWGNNGSYYY